MAEAWEQITSVAGERGATQNFEEANELGADSFRLATP
jgi:hypothetical protein